MEMNFQDATNRTHLKINPKYARSKKANNNDSNNDNNKSQLTKAWNF